MTVEMCDHVDFTEDQNGNMTCLQCGLSVEVTPCIACGEYTVLEDVATGEVLKHCEPCAQAYQDEKREKP